MAGLTTYTVEILIPTARFVFSVIDGAVDVVAEHRSPQAFALYRRLAEADPVVGMITFPNTILLRGAHTIVVDPGLHLQNEPVVRALECRGLAVRDIDAILLTHAHVDHAGACIDLPAPVFVHRRECETSHWPAVAGVLDGRTTLLQDADGEVLPGIDYASTPGHTPGGVSYFVDTAEGVVAICGDTIGPTRDDFDAMPVASGTQGDELTASWRLIRSRRPTTVIAGHLPPFAL